DAGRGTRTVALLGSTGSIGTQAVEVLRLHPDRFRVIGLSAGGADPAALARQAVELGVEVVAVADAAAAPTLREELASAAAALGRSASRIEVLAGAGAAAEVAGSGADVVLNGITGA